LPSYEAHKAALTSVSLPLSQTPVLHCETTDTGLLHRAVCQFTSQLSLGLIAPPHGGMARLSWPGWLVTYQNGQPSKY